MVVSFQPHPQPASWDVGYPPATLWTSNLFRVWFSCQIMTTIQNTQVLVHSKSHVASFKSVFRGRSCGRSKKGIITHRWYQEFFRREHGEFVCDPWFLWLDRVGGHRHPTEATMGSVFSHGAPGTGWGQDRFPPEVQTKKSSLPEKPVTSGCGKHRCDQSERQASY